MTDFICRCCGRRTIADGDLFELGLCDRSDCKTYATGREYREAESRGQQQLDLAPKKARRRRG